MPPAKIPSMTLLEYRFMNFVRTGAQKTFAAHPISLVRSRGYYSTDSVSHENGRAFPDSPVALTPVKSASVYRRFGTAQSVIVVGASKSNPNRGAPMG